MAYNQRSQAISGNIGSTNREELDKILEERRKQKMADPQAAIQSVNIAALRQNELANAQRVEVMQNPKIPLEQRIQARNEYMAANPDMEQSEVSGNQVAAGIGAASQIAGSAGPQSGGVGVAQAGLIGGASGASLGASLAGTGAAAGTAAAAGAGAGATTAGITGPQGAAIGAAIGAGVGITGALMQQRAAKKARQRDVQSKMFEQQAEIEEKAEQKRQNALKGMMDSLRSAFVWS